MTRSVVGLALAVRVMLLLSVLVALVQLYGWVREYSLLRQLETSPGSVSPATAHTADSLVHNASQVWALVFIATAIVFLFWFSRIRANAREYHTHFQRQSNGWSIGGWFCPILVLWYPYQMMTDALLASESATGESPYGTRSPGLVRAWWTTWLLVGVIDFAGRQSENFTDIGQAKTHAALGILSAAAVLVAAILLIGLVVRISTAQTQRRAAAPQAG